MASQFPQFLQNRTIQYSTNRSSVYALRGKKKNCVIKSQSVRTTVPPPSEEEDAAAFPGKEKNPKQAKLNWKALKGTFKPIVPVYF